MKLLLCKTIEKLGIVGDVVDVKPGYARNYLLPSRLATEPTEGNVRALAEARRVAEIERAQRRAELEALAEKMADVEVTLHARANEDGALYGSVGKREIAQALCDEGFQLDADHVLLARPIRHLDNMTVDVKLGDELRTSIKVWIVREKVAGEDGEENDETPAEAGETKAGTEAGEDGDSSHE